ncbi:hypothetical protein KHA93_11730 [Bacillus sp. FJAT-49732]|uniref:Uncharacterized protein n=1 Tax=Lederbergia citrisecunda TaxID=2833583 RepID=A0A942YNH4_9BACI|nr:hypothetical protein [Lederbergia citrisecunda]MBS4200301.1 hypothetical protein [Lederbergia citrisecunda]
MGRYYKELFPGVTVVEVCLCESSENIRYIRKCLLEQEHQRNLIRIAEARAKFGIVAI